MTPSTPLLHKRKADASVGIIGGERDVKRVSMLDDLKGPNGLGQEHSGDRDAALQLYNPPSSPTVTTKKSFLAVGVNTGAFKVPAVPQRAVRAGTPATSTVAASSSPTRPFASSEVDIDIDNGNDALSSSPARADARTRPATPILTTINLQNGELLVFGRHHAAWNASEPVAMPTGKAAEVHLDASLPRRAFNLPRSAKLASRCHAAIQVSRNPAAGAAMDMNGPGEARYRLVVFGQNGVRVRLPGSEKYKRMKAGQKKDLEGECEIDFHGCAVRICPPLDSAQSSSSSSTSSPAPSSPVMYSRNALSSPTLAERDMGSLSPPPSLPPSSPPVMSASLGSSDDEDESDANVQGTAQAGSSRHVSPLFDSDKPALPLVFTATSNQGSKQPEAAPKEETEEEKIEEALPVPDDVDLPAILANTVVFSGSSKLSLPDLVRHMLETAPSLRAQASEAQWRVWAMKVVDSEPMFGKVQRNGKDASGHPLLPHYFYSPDADTDANRAKELGGLVRPLRAAQRAGGKPLDWRPVGSGRRRY